MNTSEHEDDKRVVVVWNNSWNPKNELNIGFVFFFCRLTFPEHI